MSNHNVSILATIFWLVASALFCGHLFTIRKRAAVEKRNIILLFTCIALDAFSGAVGILRVFGTLESTPYVYFRLVIFFAWVPAWNFLLFLRMLLFMESGARNYGYLRAMRSGSTSENIPQVSKGSVVLNSVDRMILRILGFKNVVVSIGATQADRYTFGAPQLARAIILNVLLYGSSLVITILVFIVTKVNVMDRIKHKNSAVWITPAVITIIFQTYLIFFLSRLRHIKDQYRIRMELGLLVLLFTAIIIFVMFDMSRGDLLDMANEPAKAFSLVLVSIVTTVILYASTLTAYLLNKRQAGNVKMTFAEFEVALCDSSFLKQLKPQLALDFCMENALFIKEFEALVEMSNRYDLLVAKVATNDLPSPVTSTRPHSPSYLSRSSSILNSSQTNVAMSPALSEDMAAAVKLAAKKLYHDFVAEGSVHELNLPHEVRNTILRQLNERDITWKDFITVRREVAQSIYQNSYPQFVRKNQGMDAEVSKHGREKTKVVNWLSQISAT